MLAILHQISLQISLLLHLHKGIKGALAGTIWLMISIIPISIVLGVGTAIYLEEYAKDNFFTSFVKISISNLAGVPSIVFGLLGLTLFVRGGGIQALALGNSVIAAALTMSLLILPPSLSYQVRRQSEQFLILFAKLLMA